MKYLSILFLSVLLISCHDVKKKEQLTKVDALIASNDSIYKAYRTKEADSVSFTRIIQQIMDVELRIKRNYETDTVNLDFAKKMDAYKLVRKRLKPLGKIASQLAFGYEEEKKALTNLRTDIDLGSGDKSKYDEFIQYEQNKVDQLRVLVKELVKTHDESVETFNRLHPELDAFSRSLVKL